MNQRRLQNLAFKLWGLMQKSKQERIKFILDSNVTPTTLNRVVKEILHQYGSKFKIVRDFSHSDLEEDLQWLCEQVGFVRALTRLTEITRIGRIHIYDVAQVRDKKIDEPSTNFEHELMTLHENLVTNTQDIFLDSEFVETFYDSPTHDFDPAMVWWKSEAAIVRMFEEAVNWYLFQIYAIGADYDQYYMELLDVSDLHHRLKDTKDIGEQLRSLRLRCHPNTVDLVSSELLSWWSDGNHFLDEWLARHRRFKEYWKNWENAKKGINKAIAENKGEFPTHKRLKEMCRGDLIYAIGLHGGFAAVREKIGYNEKMRIKLARGLEKIVEELAE